MSDAKHTPTPGPWHWTWDGEGQPGRVGCSLPSIGGGYDSHCIALTQPGKFDAMANARLIAAAPELLEALLDCREALRRAGADGELRVVNAAIAKATQGEGA